MNNRYIRTDHMKLTLQITFHFQIIFSNRTIVTRGEFGRYSRDDMYLRRR